MEIKNKFVKNVVGVGEVDINKMPGFRDSTEDEHTILSEKYKKAIYKNIILMLFWTLVSAIFIMFHVKMYYMFNDMIFLVFAAVFAVTILINIYKLIFVDKFTLNKIMNKNYNIAEARIHHLMPRIVSQSGRPIAKIQDEKGNIYNQEFIINKENKKIYQKNQEEKFIIVMIDKKRRIYGLTHF